MKSKNRNKIIFNTGIFSGKQTQTNLAVPLAESNSLDNLETLLKLSDEDPQLLFENSETTKITLNKKTKRKLLKETKKYTNIYDAIQVTKTKLLQNLQPSFISLFFPRYSDVTTIDIQTKTLFKSLNTTYLQSLTIFLNNTVTKIKKLNPPNNYSYIKPTICNTDEWNFIYKNLQNTETPFNYSNNFKIIFKTPKYTTPDTFITLKKQIEDFKQLVINKTPCPPKYTTIPTNNNQFNLTQISDFLYKIEGRNQNQIHIPHYVIKCLDEGLKTVPSNTNFNYDELNISFSVFENKLLWSMVFPSNDIEKRILPNKLLQNKPKIQPPKNAFISKWVEMTKLLFTKSILTSQSKNKITKDDLNFYKTIKFFKNNSNLIIKKADKGNCVVLMTKQFYIEIGRNFLESNKDFIVTLPLDPTLTITNKITYELTKLLQENKINQLLFTILKPTTHPKTPSIYFLPKIHKNPNISGRPIVSANNHPCENISIFLDYVLQPYSTKHPLFLKDSTNLLQEISTLSNLPQHALLFSIDVVNMYTMIPIKEMINEILITINENPLLLNHPKYSINKDTIKTLLELTFETNYFEFNDILYLQTNGIAMGTACACVTSDIFICNFVEKNLFKHLYRPAFYKQYRDDSFGIWLHGKEKLDNFLNHINTLHPKIKFTMSTGKTIEYLDLKISLTEWGTIATETYYKPTDTFQMLPYNSNHPNHVKNNIPKSQLIRHIRNCTYPQNLRLHTTHLFANLLKRKYPAHLLLQKLTKHNLKRLQILKYKQKTKFNKIPLILKHQNNLPNFSNTLKHLTTMLKTKYPQLPDTLIGYSIHNSYGKTLIRAKFSANKT